MKGEIKVLIGSPTQERTRFSEKHQRWMSAILSLVCILTFAFGILWLGAQSVCSAAPPKKSCGQSSGAPGSDSAVYDRLKCRHDAVAEQLEFMANGVFAEGTPLANQLTVGQFNQVKSAKMKAARSRNKSAKEDFKKLAKSEAKSNKNPCHLVPLRDADDANNDGICDWEQGNGNALCAAIDLDTNGNLQACNPSKKNKGKKNKDGNTDLECDQICDQGESQTDLEEVEMQGEAQAMEASYDAMETDLQEMNTGLEALNGVLSTPLVKSSAMVAANACGDISSLPVGLVESAIVLRIASVTAHGVADMADKGCDQVAVAVGFGGNGSVVCTVFQGVAAIVELAYVAVDEILKAKTDELQASTFACLQTMKGSMDAGFTMLSGQHTNIMANDNANKAEIKQQIEAVRAELSNKLDKAILLLNTPQGQREQFPAK